jgi:hypothetical protein
MSEPVMARKITVIHTAGFYKLVIDGQDFPWHISEDGVATQIDRTGIPSITITIPADEVFTHHSLSAEGSPIG